MIQPTRIPIIKRSQGYFIRWYYNGWHYWQFYSGALNYKTEGEKYRTYGSRSITASSGPLSEAQVDAVRTVLNTREVYLYSDAGWMSIRVDTGSAGIKNNDTKSCEVVISFTIGSRLLSVTGYSPVVIVPEIPVIPDATRCEVIVGTQVWACKNYDSDYPGSKVYNNLESNRAIYGGLYTYDQIMNPGFCPSGWHVPTLAEWMALINNVGANPGGKLKEAGYGHWLIADPATPGTDNYGFKALGAGYGYPAGNYAALNQRAWFWTADAVYHPWGNYAKLIQLRNEALDAVSYESTTNYYMSVRLVRDTPLDPSLVRIGDQIWKNSNVSDNIAGSKVYGNDEANRADYGGLYNHTMIAAIEALYPGWHVPTQSDWNALQTYINDNANAAGKLKETGFDHWLSPNTGATNSTGFRARGGGYYSASGPLDDGWMYSFQDKGAFMMNEYLGGTGWLNLLLTSDSASWISNIMADPTVGGDDTYVSVRLIKDL